jgi:hypothetical protein
MAQFTIVLEACDCGSADAAQDFRPLAAATTRLVSVGNRAKRSIGGIDACVPPADCETPI